MPRQLRHDVEGGWYHITTRGMFRKEIFENDRDREHLPSRLGRFRPSPSQTRTCRFPASGSSGGGFARWFPVCPSDSRLPYVESRFIPAISLLHVPFGSALVTPVHTPHESTVFFPASPFARVAPVGNSSPPSSLLRGRYDRPRDIRSRFVFLHVELTAFTPSCLCLRFHGLPLQAARLPRAGLLLSRLPPLSGLLRRAAWLSQVPVYPLAPLPRSQTPPVHCRQTVLRRLCFVPMHDDAEDRPER